ncbi:XRE family transcriptional regulator [Lentibacillus kapialis]|uniref:XRE family transcriptional regulator n=1 Tax=Lentibacillus kapialis TaxID=340214 RepID=A0A917PZ93_9BACI|nr:helix-turn-helix domain-containing protein [Lentibacillus kapialis]GGK00517.1 XRE family transcriptional regulator [Lentibacillus kapialis]
MEIGEKLKEAREEQNLTLESLQETTKIQKRYLEAIEEGNFKLLPGTFYARAFIKEYAAAVGLDANELLAEYEGEIPQADDEHTTQYAHIHRSRKDNNATKNTNIFSFIPTMIVVLLVIGIIFVIWFFYQGTVSEESKNPVQQQNDQEVSYDSDENNQTSGQTGDSGSESDSADGSEPENSNDDSVEQTEESKPEFAVEEKGTSNSPESTVTLENASDDTTATIEASGESWLDVQNDAGESLFSGMVSTENSPVEMDLSGTDRVWFSVGNAPSLKISIDGTELEYPVNPEEKVYQKIWVNIKRAGE